MANLIATFVSRVSEVTDLPDGTMVRIAHNTDGGTATGGVAEDIAQTIAVAANEYSLIRVEAVVGWNTNITHASPVDADVILKIGGTQVESVPLDYEENVGDGDSQIRTAIPLDGEKAMTAGGDVEIGLAAGSHEDISISVISVTIIGIV